MNTKLPMQPRVLALLVTVLLLVPSLATGQSSDFHVIETGDFRDRVEGFWFGQLVGNYMGFPFENLYVEEPIPIVLRFGFDPEFFERNVIQPFRRRPQTGQ